jgi:hypothetical protein
MFEGDTIPDSNYLHDCEPGRILHFQGCAALRAWQDAQPPGTYASFDELTAVFERLRAEIKS